MPGSYKVYISSTFEDLKEQRQDAARAVRKLNLQTYAMQEDCTASEQKSVEKCCDEVKDCDIYIGIIAFRYGSIPKGYDKSITEYEYEAAGEARIPRLMFLIDDAVPWPRLMMDKDSTKIDAFRNFVKDQHRVTIIKKLNDFGEEVSAALSKLISEMETKQRRPNPFIPLILPYLNDRRTQQDELECLLCECENTLHQKPLVGIIHGDEDECPDRFIETLQRYILPELLCLAPDRNSINKLILSWPSPDSQVHQRINLLKSQLIRSQTMKPNGTVDDLIQDLNNRLTPLLIYSTIQADDWQKHQPELIAQWLGFWNHLPDLAIGKQIFVFLCFKYRNIEKLSRSEGKKYQALNKQMREYIDRLDNLKQYKNINGIVLSELCEIRYHELDEWLFKYASIYCDAEILRSEIEEFYRQQKMNAICMGVLAKKLLDCLNKQLKTGV